MPPFLTYLFDVLIGLMITAVEETARWTTAKVEAPPRTAIKDRGIRARSCSKSPQPRADEFGLRITILPHSERDRTENRRPPDGFWLSERTGESWCTGRESARPRKAFYPSKADEVAHARAQHR